MGYNPFAIQKSRPIYRISQKAGVGGFSPESGESLLFGGAEASDSVYVWCMMQDGTKRKKMKKTTLMMIASATILMAEGTPPSPATPPPPPPPPAAQKAPVPAPPPAAVKAPAPMMMGQQQGKGPMQAQNRQRAGMQGMKCAPGKCGQGMKMMQGKKMVMHGKKMRMHGMKKMKKAHSPFLIKHGLPHMSKMVMISWNDPAFALTPEQKTTLEGIRKKTMGSVAKLKKEILPLTRSIIAGTYSGKTADELGGDVKKLGQLEAEATIVQLQCLEETKKVLTKDQLIYLLQKSTQHKKMRKMK